jgi:nucleotide-binding universal stress UspA family protein
MAFQLLFSGQSDQIPPGKCTLPVGFLLDRALLGSVTDKVLRKAHCPVLAVRKPAQDLVAQAGAPDIIPLLRILCCTDFSDQSEEALEYAVSLATEYGGELTLLHVLEGVAESADIEDEIGKAKASLEKCLSLETDKNCKTKTLVRIGSPYQQILELALESQPDLIVMGDVCIQESFVKSVIEAHATKFHRPILQAAVNTTRHGILVQTKRIQ